MTAWFSEGGEESAQYRWRLDREVSPFGIVAALVGVNPSTAGAVVNDQTILKDMGFARLLGWRRIIKVNKFAHRATNVRDLRHVADPIGTDNDRHLAEAFDEADVIVPCWGPLAKLPDRLRRRWRDVACLMRQSGKPVMCLGTAGDGQPRHTLMLAYATPLVAWEVSVIPALKFGEAGR